MQDHDDTVSVPGPGPLSAYSIALSVATAVVHDPGSVFLHVHARVEVSVETVLGYVARIVRQCRLGRVSECQICQANAAKNYLFVKFKILIDFLRVLVPL